MLYSFSPKDKLNLLPSLPVLRIEECEDPFLLSVIVQIPLEEAQKRLLNDNRAYVAFLNEVIVGFGWMALGKAKIGELNHEFIVPAKHAYLWNFRVFQEFRGMGVYPRILQHIILQECREINYLWIMHAPENTASQNGILKAGFNPIADVSLYNAERVIFRTGSSKLASSISTWFGFDYLPASIATCWSCTSPFLKFKISFCCCAGKNRKCLFSSFKIA